jgi:hypothetical protein
MACWATWRGRKRLVKPTPCARAKAVLRASSDKRIRRQEDKKESAYENNRLSKPEGKGVRKPETWF